MTNNYQSEQTVFLEVKKAVRIKNLIANSGFITLVDEVSPRVVTRKSADQFRIVVYHPDLEKRISELTGEDNWKIK